MRRVAAIDDARAGRVPAPLQAAADRRGLAWSHPVEQDGLGAGRGSGIASVVVGVGPDRSVWRHPGSGPRTTRGRGRRRGTDGTARPPDAASRASSASSARRMRRAHRRRTGRRSSARKRLDEVGKDRDRGGLDAGRPGQGRGPPSAVRPPGPPGRGPLSRRRGRSGSPCKSRTSACQPAMSSCERSCLGARPLGGQARDGMPRPEVTARPPGPVRPGAGRARARGRGTMATPRTLLPRRRAAARRRDPELARQHRDDAARRRRSWPAGRPCTIHSPASRTCRRSPSRSAPSRTYVARDAPARRSRGLTPPFASVAAIMARSRQSTDDRALARSRGRARRRASPSSTPKLRSRCAIARLRWPVSRSES